MQLQLYVTLLVCWYVAQEKQRDASVFGGDFDASLYRGVPVKVVLAETGQVKGVCAAARDPDRNYRANMRRKLKKVLAMVSVVILLQFGVVGAEAMTLGSTNGTNDTNASFTDPLERQIAQ